MRISELWLVAALLFSMLWMATGQTEDLSSNWRIKVNRISKPVPTTAGWTDQSVHELKIKFKKPHNQDKLFYGFTLPWHGDVDPPTDIKLIMKESGPSRQREIKVLKGLRSPNKRSYWIQMDTKKPLVVYLIAATEKIESLEQIKAQIELTPGGPIGNIRGPGQFSGKLQPESRTAITKTCDVSPTIDICTFRME